jgi:hypothetical protein
MDDQIVINLFFDESVPVETIRSIYGKSPDIFPAVSVDGEKGHLLIAVPAETATDKMAEIAQKMPAIQVTGFDNVYIAGTTIVVEATFLSKLGEDNHEVIKPGE